MTSDRRRLGSTSLTPRLRVRPPTDGDRARFAELLGDESFMVFSGGPLSAREAHERFDRMLCNARRLPFAKQPVIERATGRIVGYAGVDWLTFDGEERLEFGWRLVSDARGRGYATEAGRALLARAVRTFRGELFAIVDPVNHASRNVAAKLGFEPWTQSTIDGEVRDIFRLLIGWTCARR